MSTLDDLRRLAMALPGVEEADHHGMVSFRVRSKVLSTVPDDECARIMLDENEIRAAVAEYPGFCREKYWGRKLSCVEVALPAAPVHVLEEMLTDAWVRKAPSAAVREFLSERDERG